LVQVTSAVISDIGNAMLHPFTGPAVKAATRAIAGVDPSIRINEADPSKSGLWPARQKTSTVQGAAAAN
jgi:hypothetical protein